MLSDTPKHKTYLNDDDYYDDGDDDDDDTLLTIPSKLLHSVYKVLIHLLH
jgi:hypothetical protein